MVEFEAIQQVCDRIVREFHPQKIILFGSYAYGAPSEDSDVDLLVVMPFEGRPAAKCAEIRKAVRAKFPMDLLVRTPEMVQQRVEWNDFFLREILEKGKVLHEAAYGRVG